MKKVVCCFAVLCMCVALTACFAWDPAAFYYDVEELHERVTAIELIDYENPEAKELFENRNGVIPFDFGKMKVVEVLPEERFDDMLTAFDEEVIYMWWKHDDSPSGMCLRLVYENGDFEIVDLSGDYVGGFYADGKVRRFIGKGQGPAILEAVNRNFHTKFDEEAE